MLLPAWRSCGTLPNFSAALLLGMTRLLWIILISGLPLSTNSRDCMGTANGTNCYVYSAQQRTWQEARDYCVTQENGRLPEIENEAQQAFLESWLAGLNADGVWLDGKETPRGDWHWLDGSCFSLQGCYEDNAWSRDLPTEVTVSNLIPELCVAECRNRGFKYAGAQSRTECYCGNSYGAYGLDPTPCAAACGGDNMQTCGGFGSSDIYRVNCTSGEWKYQNPDDATGYETCGALASETDGRDFIDRPCYDDSLYYVCDLYGSTSGCTDISSGHCVYIGTQTSTWFDAHADCVSRGGDLIEVGDAALRNALKAHMTSAANRGANGLYWVGLIQSEWQTNSGDPLNYTAWGMDKPDQNDSRCMASSKTLGYKWDDLNCANTYPVACQYEFTPQTTTDAMPSTASVTESTPASNAVTTGPNDVTAGSSDVTTGPSMQMTTSAGNGQGSTPSGNDVMTTMAPILTTASPQTVPPSDPCSPSPCRNGGTCAPQGNSYQCTCASGYTGTTCDAQVDPCNVSPAPCQNGGSCTGNSGVISCGCVPGYNGDRCQTNIDECASNPCQNQGTCRDGVNGYTCACVANVSGDHCENDPNECASNPCQNGGTCEDGLNLFTCRCPVNVTGVLCDNGASSANMTGNNTTDGMMATSDTNATTPSSGGNTPASGASTGGGSDSKWTTFQICLVIAVLVLIVAIVIAVAVFVYFKKSDNNVSKVRPSVDYGAEPGTAETGITPVDNADSETDLVTQ